MATAMNRCDKKKHLFVSYSHSDVEIVHKIADALLALGYQIWIDRDLVKGNALLKDIQNGIDTSHLILCFISQKYILSKNCMIEISYANNENKKVLPIMLDDYFKTEKEGLKIMIAQINAFNAFKQDKGETFAPKYFENHFKSLEGEIFKLLSGICQTCSKSIRKKEIVLYL